MLKENHAELLDTDGVPEEQVLRAYRDLTRIHHWLGDTAAIVRAIRSNRTPVRRVLDVGCATGSVLEHVRKRLGVEGIGVDLRPRLGGCSGPMILRADAVRDALPQADVAFAMHVGHHLPEGDLVAMIRNVGRFCRRFIVLDLVRHPLPLGLFQCFIAPLVSRVTAEDGRTSIRRSYTPSELSRITATALAGTQGAYRQSVAPLYARQVVDIEYGW